MSDSTGGPAVTGMASTVETCRHCGNIHVTTCPRIRAIEYHQNGAVKRIEFHGPQPVVAGSGVEFTMGTMIDGEVVTADPDAFGGRHDAEDDR